MGSQLWERTKNVFMHIWEPNQILFNIFFVTFFSIATIIITLRLAGVQGIAMTYFWVGLAIFGFLALLTLIRIKMEPKDTRLDTLITSVARLEQKIDNLATKDDVNELTKAIKALTKELKGKAMRITR